MKNLVFWFIWSLLLIGFSIPAICQEPGEPSVFSGGDWYKIAVTEDGVYKIDRTILRNLGINTSSLDPQSLAVFGNGGKMLSQEMTDIRGLKQVALKTYGLEDGEFGRNDFIIFYGQTPDSFTPDYEQNTFEYTNHVYSDTTFYFLTTNLNQTKLVPKETDLMQSTNLITDYVDYKVHERDIENLVKSGREWFGEKFDLINEYSFPFEFENVVGSKPVTLTADVLIRSESEPSNFEFYLNQSFAGEIEALPVLFGTYNARGRQKNETFSVTGMETSPSGISVDLKFNGATSRSAGYINYLLVSAYCQLEYVSDPLTFRSFESLNNTFSTFSIDISKTQTTDKLEVWDVTDPFNAISKSWTLNGSKLEFTEESDELREYVVFHPEQSIPTVIPLEQVDNQDLWSLQPPQLLIIAYPKFLAEAEDLAQLRREHDRLTVQVINLDQVFNDFASGSKDITAIRNFIKHLYDKDHSESGLNYVLLFGKGSFDYKDVLDQNYNFLPIYQSRNSIHPLRTYASDDYFGLMEEGEGLWEETEDDFDLDLAVGRIPAKTNEEARAIVDKLILYAKSPESIGDWRKDIVFVADDVDTQGENDAHIKQSERLAVMVDSSYSGINQSKIYIDAFDQETIPGGERVPEVNDELNKAVEEGTLIVNFVGHGGETIWTSERILDIFNISEWDNEYTFPLFLTATCEFGRNDDPERDSGSEVALLRESGGAIALITTTRPVFSQQNFQLNSAFYQHAFTKIDGRNPTIGEIFMRTKNDVPVFNSRNFMLLGDPSMKLAYPEYDAEITEVNQVKLDSGTVADTLSALSSVNLKGIIAGQNGQKLDSYDGKIQVTLFGQDVMKTTKGYQLNSPIEYSEKSNILFKGKATVKNGDWSLDFTLPQNTPQTINSGRFSLYAWSIDQPDASGGFDEIMIGGDPESLSDNLPPSIKIFLGDSTFTPGDIVSQDTRLLAQLTDDQGIDVSLDFESGSLYAILDDTLTFDLTSYYVADENTQKSGWVDFPLKDLLPGKHTITVFARDLLGNSNSSFMTFDVSEPNQMILKDLYNYPNPFTNSTRIVFTHNRSGEDLEVIFSVYSRDGRIVKENVYIINNSNITVNLIEWDGRITSGKKIEQGLYYYRLFVRSLEDGASSSISQKFIIY